MPEYASLLILAKKAYVKHIMFGLRIFGFFGLRLVFTIEFLRSRLSEYLIRFFATRWFFIVFGCRAFMSSAKK